MRLASGKSGTDRGQSSLGSSLFFGIGAVHTTSRPNPATRFRQPYAFLAAVTATAANPCNAIKRVPRWHEEALSSLLWKRRDFAANSPTRSREIAIGAPI